MSIPTTLRAKTGGKRNGSEKKYKYRFAAESKGACKTLRFRRKTEKDLKALSLQSILKIPDISVSDMTVITELQEQIAKNRLFSYLGGADDEQQSEQSDG